MLLVPNCLPLCLNHNGFSVSVLMVRLSIPYWDSCMDACEPKMFFLHTCFFLVIWEIPCACDKSLAALVEHLFF